MSADDEGGKDGRKADGFGPVDPEALNFRYSRDRRLDRAPELVQDMYRRGYTPNKGFIKGLTANAGLRSIFFTIIILSVVIVGVTLFSDNPDTARFPGATARLKAFLYSDTVYVSVTLESEKGSSADLLPVSALIEGLDSAGNIVASEKVSSTWTGETGILRAPLRDYEIMRIRVVLRFGETEAELSASVDRD